MTAEGAVWTPAFDGEKLRLLEEALPAACLSFALDPETGRSSVSAASVVRDFLYRSVDAQIRSAVRAPMRMAPTPHDAWLSALSRPSPDFEAGGCERELSRSLSVWRERLDIRAGQGQRAVLKLVEPENGTQWRLEYLLQASADPSFLVTAEEVWRRAPAAKKLAKMTGVDPEERLLAALALAGRVFAPIADSLEKSAPDHATLDALGAFKFLKDAAAVLSGSGFAVLLPPWWKAADAPRISVKLKARAGGAAKGTATWLEFDWNAALGEHTLTRKELEDLARMKQPLVRLRGQWVEVDQAALAKAIAFWEERKDKGISVADLFARMREEEALEVEAEGWLGEVLGRRAYKLLPAPAGLKGTLRPYQERGYSWLSFLTAQGFGACLADDMGLGKTVQALALLLKEKEAGRLSRPALLICPTSVAGNWLKEAARFAPGLKVILHHGAGRLRTEGAFRESIAGADLVVSTYALARLDAELVNTAEWAGVILDEAQNIKNPDAKQSRALRGLKAGFRLALTGTPVENRLAELWSIMEFLNPGYLGAWETFSARFAVPIERFQDAEAAKLLKRLARPFILRRLKSDPEIVPDLPEKAEMKVYCSLTTEQATLYRAVVKDMMERIEAASGISRRGLVLAALTKLKQTANHPAHFLKDGSPLPGRSGKLERLSEMLEEALSAGDSALVFTQYREMGELLKKQLQAVLMEEVLFLHGGLSAPARDALVERFQSGKARAFILTLKAGGTGLNLTRASRVFHFDRWWNPAVETQATDRAYRIGQTKNVQVHALLCSGTVEEGIDAMIDSKRALAETVLGGGESFLTELSNADLRRLFELRDDAVTGEP
ncbi:MAG: DEAD/DEAH box helicase [Elusimicrobia bacterium]|nr:DEAD/DEAH box helicase [Elusimicrobiota bacterium]